MNVDGALAFGGQLAGRTHVWGVCGAGVGQDCVIVSPGRVGAGLMERRYDVLWDDRLAERVRRSLARPASS